MEVPVPCSSSDNLLFSVLALGSTSISAGCQVTGKSRTGGQGLRQYLSVLSTVCVWGVACKHAHTWVARGRAGLLLVH